MIRPYAVAGFLLAVLPLIATPGASLTLLIQHVGAAGRRRALPVILGTATGLYVHATLAVAGLSALVMHSSEAFAAVKLVGAAYLVGLGLWTWRSAGRSTGRANAIGRPPKQTGSVYVQALLANVLNPKAASIYLTLVPQFLSPSRPLAGQIVTLATAHALLITVWLMLWAVLVGRAAGILRDGRFKHLTTRIVSVVLVSLGLRTAAT